MRQPKSQTQFDPTRTPFTSPAARFTYLDLPVHGKIMVNSDTKVVTPMSGKMYPQMPLKLPKEILDVPQPHVRTCGTPTADNRGCSASINGGCPILQQFGKVGPCNIIIEKNGKVDSAPCYSVYCGITMHGRPTSQAHYLLDGWNILTDRTTTPQNIKNPKTRREEVVEWEVPDLAPFYDHLKNGNAEPKKKRGRPRKVEVHAD